MSLSASENEEPTPSAPIPELTEKAEAPENGLRGLKHWRHDLLAGFVVSLVSLPLSSGIAIASGAPPIYGILSSIIAGLVFPFIGGSFVTISGPAAGLAPALLAIMVSLGGAGDADTVGVAYPLLLVVICVTGLLQVGMAKLGLARFAAILPASVVEGMLGAIGVLILVKALPLFFGFTGDVHAHGFIEYLAALPEWVANGDHGALAVGALTLGVMFAAASKVARRSALFRAAPPHLFGAVAGAGLAIALGLAAQNPALFIDVPANPLDGLTMPAFGALASQPDLWWAAFVGVVTLTLIDGVESLATAQAVDRIDPFHRKSEPSRVLLAMGISNVVSSLVGGLTVIPGGVKSKTNIEAGGRTLWANFVNAGFLLIFLFVAPGLVALLPKAALGAILVYTGWKMIDPAIARHLEHVGREQVVFYGATIVAILATDLLVGILIGTGVKLAYVAWHTARAAPGTPTLGGTLRSLFQDPVGAVEQRDDVSVLHIDKPVVCFNAYRLVEQVDQLHAQGKTVKLTLEDGAVVLDHTSLEGLASVGAALEGGDGLVASSSHATALRHAPKLAG